MKNDKMCDFATFEMIIDLTLVFLSNFFSQKNICMYTIYISPTVCVLKNSFISWVFRPYSPITISNIPNCPIYEKKGPTFVNDEFFPRQKCMNAEGQFVFFLLAFVKMTL